MDHAVRVDEPWALGREYAPSRWVGGMRVDAVTYESATRTILAWASAREHRYVCVASVNNVVLARDDDAFRSAMDASDMTTPDGMPLVWALRLLGVRRAERVCGPVLTDAVCRAAAEERVPVGLYGSTPDVLQALQERLHARHPGLEIVYSYPPPFRSLSEQEVAEIRRDIVASRARVVFVGLGAPKQELWMADAAPHLPCVTVGVGAAFDVIAGRSTRAPAWMQRLGLEWVFRLVKEPRRLWRRYLLGNPRFVAMFVSQLAAGVLARIGLVPNRKGDLA